jgi:hypothetical protein
MKYDKLDKSNFSIGDLHDGGDEKQYWQSRSPLERLQAIETMRKILYGSDATKRLSRFFEIAEFKKD